MTIKSAQVCLVVPTTATHRSRMVFDLTIGTDRAQALQVCWQMKLTAQATDKNNRTLFKMSYKSEVTVQTLVSKTKVHLPCTFSFKTNFSLIDPVMAEFITIMLINNKTAGT